MTKIDRPASLFLLACVSLGLPAAHLVSSDRVLAQVGVELPLVAQTVVIDGVSVRTSSGFSFSYTDPRLVPSYPSYSNYPISNYPIGGSQFYPRYNSGINNSTLINPTIVNSPGYNPGYVNPGYVNPSYQPYPYSPYPYTSQTIQTINRPSPEIVVDPQYGVRFKNPPGY